MTTLTALTAHGTFTRTTDAPYTHVVVRSSPWAQKILREYNEGNTGLLKCQAYRRFIADGGVLVTWHKGEAAAQAAAAKKPVYDADNAVLLGVFPVEA